MPERLPAYGDWQKSNLLRSSRRGHCQAWRSRGRNVCSGRRIVAVWYRYPLCFSITRWRGGLPAGDQHFLQVLQRGYHLGGPIDDGRGLQLGVGDELGGLVICTSSLAQRKNSSASADAQWRARSASSVAARTICSASSVAA